MIIYSCSSSSKIVADKYLKISFQAGSNFGGITENTDMSQVPGVKVPVEATVDAFSGASFPGFNAGLHFNHPLKKDQVETGLDYMYNYQEFIYIDAGNKYIGVRELHVSQFMIPLTYNFNLFRNTFHDAEIQLKAGLFGQANLVTGRGTGILPDYSVTPFSAGLTLGFSFMPFHFRNGNKLGIYCDAYRGSQVYNDYYNQPDFDMPGSSFIKFGLKYQLH